MGPGIRDKAEAAGGARAMPQAERLRPAIVLMDMGTQRGSGSDYCW
jgi:DNA-binding NarL/FixJ family response regulator